MGHNEFLSALCTIMTAVDFSQLLFIFFFYKWNCFSYHLGDK